MENPEGQVRIVELFSGIGGWHFAIDSSGMFPSAQTQYVAVDVNDVANSVYLANFPGGKQFCKSVEAFDKSLLDVDSNGNPVSILAMSPPCQPFSRNGQRLDLSDYRTKGLQHVCRLLKECRHPPKMIVVENVSGFETSCARDLLIDTLKAAKYAHIVERLETPINFGIPNCRLRYYLAAACPNSPSCQISSNFELPEKQSELPPLQNFLENDLSVDHYQLVDNHLRYLAALDIVRPNSCQSMCFTSGYGRCMQGTGSVIDLDDRATLQDKSTRRNLRFFSPREIARLMCFPDTFCWPVTITTRQLYKCLGNSINVKVAASIIRLAAELFSNSVTANMS